MIAQPALHPDNPVYSYEPPQRSPYHLTAEQLRFFDENGYLILRNWIPKDLLTRLQAAANRWIEQGWAVNEDDDEHDDFNFAQREAGRVMFRVNYVHSKGEAASLELLGAPQMLAVAESMCGPNFVPTYESMVFKQAGDGEAIPWHQDAVQPRKNGRIFNYDLYLDHSIAGAGALRVLPRTQREKQDICKLTDAYGWDHPDAIDVEMEPGDVLLHDVMVVHGSARVAGKALRRTIYYEFRPAEEILADGPWDREWIDRRLRLIPLGLDAYHEAYPDVAPFQWNVTDEFRPDGGRDELRILHMTGMPGSFCSAGDAVKAK
jgi:ectoine hydroxylase-related dioxygenase (phytanoyl-CoA dioxygenase family)